ncbi:MAG: hypothetical protein ACI9Y1_002133 [Lentisphaeria bacterium]|jgi:hypothetical protein
MPNNSPHNNTLLNSPPASAQMQQMPQHADAAQQKQALLAQLHEIKTPTEISWWPPAIGWWVILAIVLISTYFAASRLIRALRRKAYRKFALRTLDQINQQAHTGDANALSANEKAQITVTVVKQVMTLLKQTFFTAYPYSRKKIAGIQGHTWLNMLSATCNKSLHFSSLEGFIEQALYHNVYNTSFTDDEQLNHLLDSTHTWIKAHTNLSAKEFSKKMISTFTPHDQIAFTAEQSAGGQHAAI